MSCVSFGIQGTLSCASGEKRRDIDRLALEVGLCQCPTQSDERGTWHRLQPLGPEIAAAYLHRRSPCCRERPTMINAYPCRARSTAPSQSVPFPHLVTGLLMRPMATACLVALLLRSIKCQRPLSGQAFGYLRRRQSIVGAPELQIRDLARASA